MAGGESPYTDLNAAAGWDLLKQRSEMELMHLRSQQSHSENKNRSNSRSADRRDQPCRGALQPTAALTGTLPCGLFIDETYVLYVCTVSVQCGATAVAAAPRASLAALSHSTSRDQLLLRRSDSADSDNPLNVSGGGGGGGGTLFAAPILPVAARAVPSIARTTSLSQHLQQHRQRPQQQQGSRHSRSRNSGASRV